ncbi:MAG: succinate dehydrogenase assembly factor 2 [Candidatus Azotimanducaceae bacterium]|uniref:FAD assembly factor SdhE n=1 Tax=OM182 bacterium TaxID=2510334 RepID=A0A520S1K7_9GAMM|nr:response regulator receiver protein [Gammaproteobacteria bacterium]RZO76321.1 MAG: succinate dehydrogenase assembly factor 2 family protein [OM182 bacterium]
MISNEERNRLCWRSRRGVLELDLLLGPFIQEMYEALTPEQRKTYALLLEQEDTDLLDWFARKKVAENDSLQKLVDIILDHA